MDKKIYILVPAYNVEKYIKECFESVINQTYKNWEMIVVDDGSTDSTGRICDEYAEKDSRIKIIHQNNKGLFGARITAVDSLKDIENTYCMFFDSDDILPLNTLEIHLKAALEKECDIVCGQSVKFLSYSKPKTDLSAFKPNFIKIYEKDEIVNDIYRCCFGYDIFSVSLCFKIYKTRIIKDSFSEIDVWPKYFGEDLNATMRILPKANRVAVIDNVVYFHRLGGGTNRFMKSFVDDCLLLYKEKNKYAQKYNLNEYTFQLIDVEMKNMAAQYLIMCKRTKTYPHGNFRDEIKYITEIPEFYNAVNAIREDTLKRDGSEITGFVQAFIQKDYDTIEALIKKKAGENKLRRMIKKFL